MPWYSPSAGADIALIKGDLETCMTTDANGQPKINIPAFLSLAATRLAAIPDPTDPYVYSTPELLRNANVRPLLDTLQSELDKLNAANAGVTITNLQPYLNDLKVKSDAVTAYFYKLYDVEVPALLLEDFATGSLEQNVPAPDDLTKETRYYRTTFVDDWESESAPSEVSDAVEFGFKDTVTIDIGTVPPGRNLAHWRVYRSNVGSETAAFEYVPNDADELGVPVATPDFEDEVPNSELQEVCPSTIWAEPPANLRGLIGMANGIHLGFFGRTLAPSESYVPYAYPTEYQITVEYDIVGLCPWGQSAFVGTAGKPYFVTGADAASLTAQVLDANQACVSARSICPTAMGPVYASPDGLCLARPEGVKVLTAPHFTREEWQALPPENIIAQEHDGVVYMFVEPEYSNLGWNPLDKHANITLSDSNRNALLTTPANWRSARATQSRTTGILYFEVGFAAGFTTGASSSYAIGVCDATMSLTGDPIFDAVGGNRAAFRANGQAGTQGGYSGSFGGFGTNGVHTMGIKANFSTRAMSIYLDGVYKMDLTWGSGSAAMFPFTGLESGSMNQGGVTVRLLRDEFVQALPSGATPWAEGA